MNAIASGSDEPHVRVAMLESAAAVMASRYLGTRYAQWSDVCRTRTAQFGQSMPHLFSSSKTTRMADRTVKVALCSWCGCESERSTFAS